MPMRISVPPGHRFPSLRDLLDNSHTHLSTYCQLVNDKAALARSLFIFHITALFRSSYFKISDKRLLTSLHHVRLLGH
ncbi:unnamed protein product [Periconia digitata]|uniref:Uncharacterized protein n=1 Tax=Periconia digitata TaxID=1303443 RepID=A0A9W4UF59_9PLEO|nr:unnamed protein product [Periconia digitata]